MKTILFSTFVMISMLCHAQISGTLTKRNVKIGDCYASSITVKYKIGKYFGEPTVNGSYKVNGNDSSCQLPYNTTIWLKISSYSGSYGFIRLSPVKPKINGGYGYNFTGSPNWSRFICGFDGSRATNCFNKEKAKNLYESGSINDFVIAY